MGVKRRGVLARLDARAALSGEAEAFRRLPDGGGGGGAVWGWAELRDRAQGVAAALEDVKPGGRVLLAYSGGLDFIAAFFGCLYAGLAAVPVSPPRRREQISRWRRIAESARPRAILHDDILHGPARALAQDIGLSRVFTPQAADPARPRPAARGLSPHTPDPNDPAFLQYTSGSTGAPRGVMVAHAMLETNLEQIRQAFGYRDDDRTIGWLPHYHDMGLLSGVIAPVWLGTPHALMSPAAFLRDPLGFLRQAGALGATVIGGPDFGYAHAARKATPEALRGVDLSGLRMAFTGAEAIRADTLRRFGAAFAPCGFRPDMWAGCYGMAEATVCVSVTPPGEGARILSVDSPALARGRIAPGADAELVESGVPAPGVEIAIVAAGRRVSGGEIGEIWLRGANIASGYWRASDAGAEAFGQTLDGESGWFATGDRGALIAGRLFVTGRAKEVIVIRGRNLHPQDIEATLCAAHPALTPDRAAAFALEQGGDGGMGVLCELTRSACRNPDPDPVFAAIRAALARRHGVAAQVIALVRPGAAPVTPSGKIQRLACRDALKAGGAIEPLALWRAQAQEAVIPGARGALAAELRATPKPLRRGRLLAELRAGLARLTGEAAEAIPAERGFFDLGLDSANALILLSELEQRLDLPMEATILYEHPSPGALATHLLAELAARPALEAAT